MTTMNEGLEQDQNYFNLSFQCRQKESLFHIQYNLLSPKTVAKYNNNIIVLVNIINKQY